MCWRCIQVCAEDVQYTFALTWGGRGFESHVATAFHEDMPDTTCVFCGNCVGACPTGALKGKVEYDGMQNASGGVGEPGSPASPSTRGVGPRPTK
jgi:predicted molibdopterin-dependent oxidoreductase YjgC